MRKILLILNICAFIASIIWLYNNQDFEQLISSILTLAGLIGFVVTKPKNETDKKVIMKQKAGNNSRQYQSGGNMTINN
jgi:hypothetical protein